MRAAITVSVLGSLFLFGCGYGASDQGATGSMEAAALSASMTGDFNTESYDRIYEKRLLVRAAASVVDVLNRRRYGVLLQREKVSERGPAATQRRRTDRGVRQLLPL